jgi:alcohol dehydrogenase class IV
MAIISQGEVIALGNPSTLVGEVQGRIWRKVIAKHELSAHRDAFQVISTQLKAGKTEVHVFSVTQPDPSFTLVEAGLEDVYFSRIAEKTNTIPA